MNVVDNFTNYEKVDMNTGQAIQHITECVLRYLQGVL